MSEHQIFSLHTILTSRQIKPEVYKHIIREIKSPLQQQSFQLTNDESNNSYVMKKIPKRPNIPPTPSKSLRVHYQNNQFSRTYESFSEDLQLGHSKYREENNGNLVQSFVSPLQYEVNSRQHLQNNFCGVFESILKIQDRSEILLPTKSRRGKRKPIFQKKQQQKPLKTLDQALSKLKAINQNQLVLFLQFMGELQTQLVKLLDNENSMQNQLPYIFQRLAMETQYCPSSIQSNQAHSKILQRLKSKNSGQVIKKIFKRDINNEKVGQVLLQKLFIDISNIQTIIYNFIAKEESIQQLTQAFEFITHNFQQQLSFKSQLSKFYDTLSINISTNGLQLIWQSCGSKKLRRAEFMQGLNLNHFIIRQKQRFEDILVQKGFVRNEQ